MSSSWISLPGLFEIQCFHPRVPHFQGSNDSIVSWFMWLQGGRSYRRVLMALSPHSYHMYHSAMAHNAIKMSLPAWWNTHIPRYARDLKIKSKSPPWVGSTLSCNLWACPREPVSGTFRSVEQLLKCHQSIFDSIELIMKSVPASSLIIFEILI